MKITGFFSIVLLLGIISCNSSNETAQVKEKKTAVKSEKLNELSQLPVLTAKDTLADSLNAVIPAQDPNSFYWGLIDSVTGKTVLDYKYHYIYTLENNRTFVFLNGQWGVLDRTGKVLAEPYHSRITSLGDGYIELECYTGNGVIDREGKQLFPYYGNTSYKVLAGLNRVSLNTGAYGAVMDLKGKTIIPFDSHYTRIQIFPEGIGVAWKRMGYHEKAAILDLNGKMIYPFIFDRVGPMVEGRMSVYRNNEYGFLDEKANVLFYRNYGRVDDYYHGFARVMKNQRVGFVNKAGKEITPVHFGDGTAFSEGYAPVNLSGKYGFIDTNGTTVVPFKYQGAEHFRQGIALVWHTNGDKGAINYKGEEIVPVKYKELRRNGKDRLVGKIDSTFFIFDFQGNELANFQCDYLNTHYEYEELYLISKNGKVGILGPDYKIQIPVLYDALEAVGKNVLMARKDEKAGFIDFKGNVLTPFIYTEIESYDDGVARVWLNGKMGLMNLSRKLVVPAKYDNITSFEYGLAVTERKEKYGLIDYSGKEILLPVYDSITIGEYEIRVEKNGESFSVDRQGKRLEDEGGC